MIVDSIIEIFFIFQIFHKERFWYFHIAFLLWAGGQDTCRSITLDMAFDEALPAVAAVLVPATQAIGLEIFAVKLTEADAAHAIVLFG